MAVHVRRFLADHDLPNGDVVAIRQDGKPVVSYEWWDCPAWTLHLYGGGTASLASHPVDSEKVFDACGPRAGWAVAAMRQLAEKLARDGTRED